jgi:hypothetical protein
MVVVVPLTVKLPDTVKLLLIVVVPVTALKFNAVAAPNALTVVAVALSKSNDALDVVADVSKTGLVNVLLVKVSVVARPTKVSVLVGRVNTPEFVIVLIVGLVNVLLVKVSVVARPTKVSVLVGRVNVPELTMALITGLVNVLLVKVSVVARPTKVSVLVGKVNTPVLTILPITGLVNVLLVKVSAPVTVATTEFIATVTSPTPVTLMPLPALTLVIVPEVTRSNTNADVPNTIGSSVVNFHCVSLYKVPSLTYSISPVTISMASSASVALVHTPLAPVPRVEMRYTPF